MQARTRAWTAALLVLGLTVGAVVLDIADSSVRNFWYHHAFSSSVVSGLLVLLLTVLIVDRVNGMRKEKDQSRAVGVQAAVIAAQAGHAADAIKRRAQTDEQREESQQELRTYMLMLLTSAPILIEGDRSRFFLETAQQTAGELLMALRSGAEDPSVDVGPRVEASLDRLKQAAEPVVVKLDRFERRAVESPDGDPAVS